MTLSNPATRLLAQRRARARRNQGGAVIFIVATTLGVLAVMGVYALTATTQDVRAAGYVQRATQAHYVADYGAVAAADYVTYENADNIINVRMLNPNALTTSSDRNCISTQKNDPSLFGSVRAKSCIRISADELKIQWGNREPFTSQSFSNTSTTTDQTDGDVYIELTNPVQAPPPPGYDVNMRFKYAMVTVTAFGVMKPRGAVGADTMQVARGRFIIGPVSQ